MSWHRGGELEASAGMGQDAPVQPAVLGRPVDAGNCSLAEGREGGGESGLGPRERQRREN